jgi:Ca2+-binding EF-hand superfamily protein
MIFAIESFSDITNVEQDMLTSPSSISGKDQPFFSIDDRESLVKMPSLPLGDNYEENSISSEDEEDHYSEEDENDVEYEDENILLLKNNKTKISDQNNDDSNSPFVEYDGRHIGIQNGCQILGLNSFSSGYIIQHFRDLSEDNGTSYGIISHSRFHQGLSSLINRHYSTLSVSNQAIADYIISCLFVFFDHDESGYFDLQDLSCGLLLLCGGSLREKSESASIIIKDQYSFDEIAAERMASCFTSIFKVAMCLDPNFISMSTAEDVAAEITISAWAKSGLALYEDDKLPRSDFESWVNIVLSQFQDESEDKHVSDNDSIGQNINSSHSNNVNSDTESEGDDLEDSSSSVILELRAARSILGLENYTADDLMETLGESASHGILSMNSFLEALTNISGLTIPVDQRPISLSLGKRIFNYFDVEGKGTVLYSDFAAGFSTLSDSPYSDKIMVGFTCLDGDGDGLLSFKEVERLILANLKVTVASSAAANNKLNDSSVDLNSLAFIVTHDGFSSLEVHCNSYLNLEQVLFIAGDCMRVSNCF